MNERFDNSRDDPNLLPRTLCFKIVNIKVNKMKKEKYTVQVIIEQDEDNRYIASCPALQGCYTQGDTFEEALDNIKEVVRMCIEELEDEGKPLDLRYPEVIALKQIEVAV